MRGDLTLRGELDEHVELMLDLLNDYDFELAQDSVAEARDQLDTMVRLGTADPEPVDTVEDVTIAYDGVAVPARVYAPEGEGPHPTLVFYHGGGFALGSVDSHDNLCRMVTNRADCVTVSVGYRLAPEHPWPAGIEDAYAAARWAASNVDQWGGDPTRLAVGGDSAGGNFATVVSMMAAERGMPTIDKQLLLYPSTVYLDPMQSRAENGDGYFITAHDLVWFVKQYIEDEIDAHHPWAFPMNARDDVLADLPPAYVMTCGYDPLRDEGIAYAERLRANGVDVTHSNYESMIHGFLNMEDIVDRCYDGVAEIAAEIRGL
jgi:acetyl esterase